MRRRSVVAWALVSASFDMPGEPVRMSFTREGFVAKAKDMWTDTWKRVE